MPQKPNEQSTYQFWKKDKKQGEVQKLEESIPDLSSREAEILISHDTLQSPAKTEASTVFTLSDYKSHILGWHHGASGQSPDWSNMSDNPQYRTGFDTGRKTRNDYARALKRRVQ